MNEFMTALWNAEGCEITGFRNDEGFHGKIINVRTKAGTDLQARVKDIDTGETFLVNGSTIYNGEGGVFHNLHVYF